MPACPLTARQLEVAQLKATGLTYGQVALELGLSEHTVRSHLSDAYRRLGVAGWPQLVTVLRESSPWQAVYLHEFDRHLAGEPDARERMSLALLGLGHKPRGDRCRDRVPDSLLRVLGV